MSVCMCVWWVNFFSHNRSFATFQSKLQAYFIQLNKFQPGFTWFWMENMSENVFGHPSDAFLIMWSFSTKSYTIIIRNSVFGHSERISTKGNIIHFLWIGHSRIFFFEFLFRFFFLFDEFVNYIFMLSSSFEFFALIMTRCDVNDDVNILTLYMLCNCLKGEKKKNKCCIANSKRSCHK